MNSGNAVIVGLSLLCGVAIWNLVVNGQNTAAVLNAGGTQTNAIFKTLTSNNSGI